MSWKNDWQKVVLAEIKPGYSLADKSWSPLAYVYSFPIGASNKIVYFANEADNQIVNGSALLLYMCP